MAVTLNSAVHANHARARVGLVETVPGTPATLAIGAGDVDTWQTLTSGAFTGGSLSNGMENQFTFTASTGIVQSTFTDDRPVLFVGSAQISISVPLATITMGLFLNTETDPILNLLSPLDFTAIDHTLSLSGNKVLDVTGGDYFKMKGKSDTACTITFHQLSVSFWGV